MAKNKFAQLLNGRVVAIYDTDLMLTDLPELFSPTLYWIDVTDMECEVGYVMRFVENKGIVPVKPANNEYTLQDYKNRQKEKIKLERVRLEDEILKYGNINIDFDAKSRERILLTYNNLKIKNSNENIYWTTADDGKVLLNIENFEEILKLGAERMQTLHEKYTALKIMIEMCEDIESVKKITFDTPVDNFFNQEISLEDDEIVLEDGLETEIGDEEDEIVFEDGFEESNGSDINV